MRAELDTINGEPVLRIEVMGYYKRASVDLPLTKEQVQKIVNMRESVR